MLYISKYIYVTCYQRKRIKNIQLYLFSLLFFEKEFSPIEEYSDSQGQRHVPKVQNSTTIEADGTKKKIIQAEAVLNWQIDNLLSQNKVRRRIEKKVDPVQTSLSIETPSLRQVIQ